MRYRIAALMLGFAALAAGCTTASGTPATAPSVPETLAPTTTTSPPTTTVAPATTTTIDRLSEIQAIFEEIELRRLRAIYDQDEKAYRAVFANQGYMERSLEVLTLVEFIHAPERVKQEIVRTITDTDDCIAALIRFDNTGMLVGGGEGESIHVVELRPDGSWGLSYIGTGWTCDGPHPFS